MVFISLLACELVSGAEVPEALTRFNLKRSLSTKTVRKHVANPADTVEMAREQFQIAAKAGCDLGFQWLKRLEDEEKHQVVR